MRDSDAPIGMIGLGRIGIALAMRLIDAHIPVPGFEAAP
jgi:6-phosphogluconate dehydrogenase (decarboxylating)